MTRVAVTWAFCAAVWLLLVDTASLAELVAGAVAATLATIVSELVHAQHLVRFSARPSLLRALPRQLTQVPIDLWLLVRELVKVVARRHPRARFHSVPFPGGTKPEDDAHRATVEWFGSLAPNTIVLGVDEEQVVVHQLSARAQERRRLEEAAQ